MPEQYGGSGLDPLDLRIALEALGYGCRDGGLVFSLCAHLLSCVVPLWQHGNEEQKRNAICRACATASSIGAHAITEPGSGSDAFAMRTRAEPDGRGFRINGTKTFISNGPVADLVIVFALTDPSKGFHGGVTAFLVERGTRGFRAGPKFEKLGLRTSPDRRARVRRTCMFPPRRCSATWAAARQFHCRHGLGAHLPLREPRRHHRATARNLDRVRANAQAVRPADRQVPGGRHRIADMKVQLEAARLLIYRAAWRLATLAPPRSTRRWPSSSSASRSCRAHSRPSRSTAAMVS